MCAKPALDMLLAAVSDLTTDKSRLESRVLVLESELQAHQNEMGLLRSSADKAREHGLDQIKDLEVALAKLQQERSAEAERMAEERKDLEGKLRETERQADWARGERDEEVDKAAREKRDLVQRLRDSEQQVAKLKVRASC